MRPSDLFGGSPFGRRVRRPGAGRVPVTVVTGFLGAGKTSLIRAALASPDAARTAVIVNEFAELGVDDVLLRTSAEDVRLIGNGCMCCAARSDLQRVLRNLFAERETGAVPPFDRVIVETSGLSDPGPVLQLLAGDRALSGHYAVSALVTVVDCVLALDGQAPPEWIEQVALADRIVLSKTGLASEAQVARVRAHVAALNPGAEILEASNLRAHPLAWLAPMAAGGARGFRAAPAAVGPDAVSCQSFVLSFDTPFRWEVFLQVMETLLALRGDDVLRVKGLVHVEGCAGPVAAHFVRHLAARPEELTAWPDADRRSRLVFITRNVSAAQVQALFDAALALAPPPG